MSHPHDERKPALTTWVVRDADEPEEWSVNISMDILQIEVFQKFMETLSKIYMRFNEGEAALLAHFWAEDLQLRLDELGGSEAAARVALKESQERADGEE